MPTTLTRDQRAKVRATVADPTRFVRSFLGRSPWRVQAEILTALNRPNARVAVKACHSSGKTWTAAAAMVWFQSRFKDAKSISTAPTYPQVRELLWKELHGCVQDANERGMDYPVPHETRWAFPGQPERWAVGRATNQGVRFQGFHGRILFVLDEAPGVLPEIWDAIEGAAAGGDVRILALGNPVIPSGNFYNIWGKQEPGWERITISAFDTPNLEGCTLESVMAMDDDELGATENPNLTSRRFVRDSVLKYGLNSAFVQARVLGMFPDQAEDALIGISKLEAARDHIPDVGGKVRAGIDVAGPGEDETVLCVRQGGNIVLLQAWASADPRGEVLAALEPFRANIERINVDSIGIGYNFALHIGDSHKGKVTHVNVGSGARDSKKFANLKAELYWGLREAFEAGEVGGLIDELAISQLAGIRYQHTAQGKIAIEGKDEARKRGVTSPDRAEAIMLAFAETKTATPAVAPWGLGGASKWR